MYEPTPRISVKAAQLADQLRDLAALFLQKNMPGEVVTVVRATLSPDFRNATLWIRVYPATRSIFVIEKIQRQKLNALQRSISASMQRKIIPRLHVAIDQSEELEAELSSLLS